MSLRFLRAGFLFLVLGLGAASAAANLTIVRVYSGWRDAASFKRISEYFTGRENTGSESVLRTQPAERAGFYYLVRVSNAGAPRAITARLELITEATAQPVVHTFSPTLEAGDTTFRLGLTGTDWPDSRANPVAWKLELLDDSGTVLAAKKSYLWEKPAAK